jgi:hypothetical protein
MNREHVCEVLEPSIREQLNELAMENHCGAGSVVKSVGRAEIQCRMASVDRLACEVELVSVSHPRMSSLSAEQLQAIADHLAEQLSYLEERLIVLEVDSALSSVQMRSRTPQVSADSRSYFEVQVAKHGVNLQRYCKKSTERRERVAAVLTREVFSRLCIDLVLAVAE